MLTSNEQTQKKKIQTHLRYLEYYDAQKLTDNLYKNSENGKIFTNLMKLITKDTNIKLAYRTIKSNKGSYTPGIDGRTIKDIAKLEEQDYVNLIKKQFSHYAPRPVKRVEIPKANGETRPLGIPAIVDRLVQQCILQILEPICEAKFHKSSYGFRPNRSAEHAIASCHKHMQLSNLHYVVDIDIKGFFDNVNHSKLIKQMWALGIRDKKLICIIKEMLKAPIVMPNKSVIYPDKGTPQGGILSPLLSLVVLNELDWWIASQWEEFPTRYPYKERVHSNGTIGSGHTYRELRKTKLKEVYIVRYADDFKLFCRDYPTAKKIFIATEKWLEDRLKLNISKEKSRIVNLRYEYSHFLGFKTKVKPKGNKYTVKSRVTDKAKIKIEKALKRQIYLMEYPKNTLDEIKAIERYNSMVIGIHQYYQLASLVSKDFREISFKINKHINNRITDISKKGKLENEFLRKKYGKSKAIRYLHGTPILPVSYVNMKIPRMRNPNVNKYSAKGRKEIHENLALDENTFKWLLNNPLTNSSIEKADNCLSLFSRQKGKCAITNLPLKPKEIICYHRKNLKEGNDIYRNLMLISVEGQEMIESEDESTIQTLITILNLKDKDIKRINKWRKNNNLNPI